MKLPSRHWSSPDVWRESGFICHRRNIRLVNNMMVSDIVNLIIQSIAFILGLLINIRIIYVCLNDKSSKTRNIHIIYSIFSTILYLFDIPFVAFPEAFLNLSMYTGEWLCHISSFIIIFCIHIIFMNSFWVALMKYVLIMHWDRALLGTMKKSKELFWLLFLFYHWYLPS